MKRQQVTEYQLDLFSAVGKDSVCPYVNGEVVNGAIPLDNLDSINMNHYKGLVSSTLRVKSWVYLTIGKIYGEAVWFDDPIRELKDLSQFSIMNINEVVTSCKDLLTKGFDGVDGRHSISWKEWLDPHTETSSSMYRYWDFMTPEYFALYAELCLWSGDYQTTVNLILNVMNTMFASTNNDAVQYLRNARMRGGYSGIWNRDTPLPQEVVSTIIYDYSKNQTNNLLKHFDSEFPNQYLLAPSEVGINRFSDPEFNPLGGAISDGRAEVTFGTDNDGNSYIRKFRPNKSVRPFPYQDDVHIYIYISCSRFVLYVS